MFGSATLFGLVASAGAIMIPSNIAQSSEPGLNIVLGEPPVSQPAESTRLFLAECRGCPYAKPNKGSFVWQNDVKNNLVGLSFTR
jgi:hypothetical protein